MACTGKARFVISADAYSVPNFKTSPEIIRLAVMMYIRFPLPFMLRFTTISTNNATFIAARISSSIAPPPSPSGVNLLPDAGRAAVFGDPIVLV